MKAPDTGQHHQATDKEKEFRSWSLLVLVMLGFVLRMYHITAPPDDFQSWRDTQGLMVARNFFEGNMNLFRPEVDWRNATNVELGGVVGITELMITQWLTACLYHVFGMAYWVGRVVPICFSLLGIILFHRLVARFQGEIQATVAATILTFLPYFFYCGRVQMPESFAFCMVFAALLTYDIWLEKGGVWRFLLAVLFAVLMLLGKPQMGVHVAAMAYLTFARFGVRTPITGSLYAFGIWVTVPFVAYYWWSNVVLLEEARLSFAGPVFFELKRILSNPNYYRNISQSVFFQSVTPAIFILGVLGLFFKPYGKRGFFAHAWLVSALLLFVIFAGGTKDNGYYQLILEPPFAILAARVLGPCFTRKRLRPIAGLVLVGACAYSLSFGILACRPYNVADRFCGEWIRENTPEDALVITESGSPSCLYFSDRKGWTCWQEYHGKRADFTSDWIDRLIEQGADVLAVTNPRFDSHEFSNLPLRDNLYDTYDVIKGMGFTVFLLDSPSDLSLTGGAEFGSPEARKYLRGMWGYDRLTTDGGRYVALRYEHSAAIQFSSAAVPNAIRLEVASTVPNQTLTVYINDRAMDIVSLPEVGSWVALEVRDLPPREEDGMYTVFLEVDLQNEETRTGLLLKKIEVFSDTVFN